MLRIGALASHGGSILQAVIDAISAGTLNAQIVFIGCNNSDAEVLHRAKKNGIPAEHISLVHHPNERSLDQYMTHRFLEVQADIILLAGYMRKIGPIMLDTFTNRIINTHPALLPKFGGQGFYGRRIHEAVIKSNETETGVTIHLVDKEYDTGPILIQSKIPIEKNETTLSLEQKVKTHEKSLVVSWLKELTI
tara:strand:- start:1281 stop:1859 length:579 start_codon:yes stop_codon:yes gene_type:complete